MSTDNQVRNDRDAQVSAQNQGVSGKGRSFARSIARKFVWFLVLLSFCVPTFDEIEGHDGNFEL